MPKKQWLRFPVDSAGVANPKNRPEAHELDVQANAVDARLMEIEHQLPDELHVFGRPASER